MTHGLLPAVLNMAQAYNIVLREAASIGGDIVIQALDT